MKDVRAELLRELSSDKYKFFNKLSIINQLTSRHMKWGPIASKNASKSTPCDPPNKKYGNHQPRSSNRRLGPANPKIRDENQHSEVSTATLKFSQIEPGSTIEDRRSKVLNESSATVRQPLKELSEKIEQCLSNSRRSADLLCKLLSERRTNGFTELKKPETLQPATSHQEQIFDAVKAPDISAISRKTEDFQRYHNNFGNPFLGSERQINELTKEPVPKITQHYMSKISHISAASISPMHSLFATQPLDLETKDLSSAGPNLVDNRPEKKTEQSDVKDYASNNANRLYISQFDSITAGNQPSVLVSKQTPAYYFSQTAGPMQPDGELSARSKAKDPLRKCETAVKPVKSMKKTIITSDFVEQSQRDAPDPTANDSQSLYLSQNQFYFPFGSKETNQRGISNQAAGSEANPISHRRVKSSIELGTGLSCQRKLTECFSKLGDRFTHQGEESRAFHKQYKFRFISRNNIFVDINWWAETTIPKLVTEEAS